MEAPEEDFIAVPDFDASPSINVNCSLPKEESVAPPAEGGNDEIALTMHCSVFFKSKGRNCKSPGNFLFSCFNLAWVCKKTSKISDWFFFVLLILILLSFTGYKILCTSPTAFHSSSRSLSFKPEPVSFLFHLPATRILF